MAYMVRDYRTLEAAEYDMNLLEKEGWTVYCTSYCDGLIVTYHRKDE